ncbi:MAG: FAD binding domain-containing protein [Steroidobacterales bacterium]
MSRPELIAPRDLAGLASALGQATSASRLVAGGTDLMLRLRTAGARPDLLIDLSGLRELSFIRKERDRIRIGSLTTFAEIQRDATLRSHAGCLAQAAAHVGSVQIRNVATIGGNVANASPCADAIPALLVLDAEVGVLGSAGSVARRPLRELLAQAGETTLRSDEAIVDFSFAPLAEDQRSAFGKIGVRTSVAVSRLSAALIVTLGQRQQVISQARVAFGSIAPRAFVDDGVAAVLRAQPLNSATVESFAEACSSTVTRSIPGRGSRPYKQQAVRGLAHDLWNAVQGGQFASPD